ncbi:hypothetical protein [Streptomyces griseocarneus]|uniref:hypothetical protein n=1 Tax=Streptomyces griseocarneus TaxID=51201 RepID=UPI001F60A829|nr:hypothetical protein [Streptomyces griseocarneus]
MARDFGPQRAQPFLERGVRGDRRVVPFQQSRRVPPGAGPQSLGGRGALVGRRVAAAAVRTSGEQCGGAPAMRAAAPPVSTLRLRGPPAPRVVVVSGTFLFPRRPGMITTRERTGV